MKVDQDAKEKAKPILEKLGLSLSTYINLSLHQLVIQERIPFDVMTEKKGDVSEPIKMEEEKIETRDLKDQLPEKKSPKKKNKTAKALAQFNF